MRRLPIKEEVEQRACEVVADVLMKEDIGSTEEQAVGDVAHLVRECVP